MIDEKYDRINKIAEFALFRVMGTEKSNTDPSTMKIELGESPITFIKNTNKPIGEL